MDTNYEIGVEDNEIIHTFSETMTLEEVVERFNLTPEQTIQLEELVRQQAQELGWNVVDTIEPSFDHSLIDFNIEYSVETLSYDINASDLHDVSFYVNDSNFTEHAAN